MPKIRRQSLLTVDLQPDESREWYFCFSPNAQKLPWYQRFAMRNEPEEVRHTYAFSQVGNTVLFVEPYFDKIDFVIKEAPCLAIDCAQQIANAGHLVLHHRFSPNIRGKSSIWNFIPSCVTVVKVSTGFDSSAKTPMQLVNDLIKKGADVILSDEINGKTEVSRAK